MKNNHSNSVPAAKVHNGIQYSNNNYSNSTSILPYNGTNITFELANGNAMVNLTDVAKAFPDKNLTQIINSQEISDYCNALSKLQNYSFVDLLTVRKGAPHLGGGTWAHKKVALRVAQKLSPEFAVWVDTKLEELLTQGVSTISDDDAVIAQAMDVLQRRLDESRRKAEALQFQNELQARELKESAPKVEYVDEVLQSVNTYTSTQMAKELGLRTAEQLHTILKDKGIMINQSGQWMLTAKYSGHGYTKPRTHPFTRNDGSTGTNTITVWTEKGRWFLHNTFVKGGKI